MSDVNEDSDAYEAEDKGINPLAGSLKLGLNVLVPPANLDLDYDQFVAYSEYVAEEAARRMKDAMIDEWFKQQPLYGGVDDGPL